METQADLMNFTLEKLQNGDFPIRSLCQESALYNMTCLPATMEGKNNNILLHDLVVWAIAHPWLPIITVVLYLISIPLIQRCMASHKGFDLKGPLILWNILLSVFSFYGAIRCLPHLFWTIQTQGWRYSMCEITVYNYGHGGVGILVVFFILSKFPELLDTYFILFRKRKLIFLHWYHHVTVLLYCWHSLIVLSSNGLYFAAMNYSVHSVMYFYYALSLLKINFIPPLFITIFQISQMFFGIAVVYMVYNYKQQGFACAVPDSNMHAAMVMYTSYAALFVNFFIQRFCCPKKKTTKTS